VEGIKGELRGEEGKGGKEGRKERDGGP